MPDIAKAEDALSALLKRIKRSLKGVYIECGFLSLAFLKSCADCFQFSSTRTAARKFSTVKAQKFLTPFFAGRWSEISAGTMC